MAAHRFLLDRFGAGAEMGPDLPQGEWSRAYAFRHAGRELVLRINRERFNFDVEAWRADQLNLEATARRTLQVLSRPVD